MKHFLLKEKRLKCSALLFNQIYKNNDLFVLKSIVFGSTKTTTFVRQPLLLVDLKLNT